VKEFLVYTALRLALFVAALAVVLGVWWIVVDTVTQNQVFVAVLIAFVVSGGASYFLLHGHREHLARKVEERAERAKARIEEIRSREDT
jgi:cell division protein FtsL